MEKGLFQIYLCKFINSYRERENQLKRAHTENTFRSYNNFPYIRKETGAILTSIIPYSYIVANKNEIRLFYELVRRKCMYGGGVGGKCCLKKRGADR